jgi:hypothetical protein
LVCEAVDIPNPVLGIGLILSDVAGAKRSWIILLTWAWKTNSSMKVLGCQFGSPLASRTGANTSSQTVRMPSSELLELRFIGDLFHPAQFSWNRQER